LHQLLIVSIEIAGPAEVGTTIGGIHSADLQLSGYSIRGGLLLNRDPESGISYIFPGYFKLNLLIIG